MTRALILVAALVATPAYAQADDNTPIVVENYRIKPAETVPAVSYRIETQDEKTRRAAMRWETAFVVLAAADLAMTVSCIEANKCQEANPLAKSHSSAKMIAIKGILTAGHFAFVHRLSKRNPKAALRVAQVSVGLQGGVVGWNLTVLL